MSSIAPMEVTPLRAGWQNAFYPLRPIHQFNDIKTLADAEPWLEAVLHYLRDAQYLSAEISLEYGITTINNLYRLFDELKTRGRPTRPTDLTDFFKVEGAVSELLAWVREASVATPADVSTQAKRAKSRDEVNDAARRFARRDPKFSQLSVHKMAGRIQCSPSTLRKTDFWTDLVREQPRRQRSKNPTPKVVSLTAKLSAGIAQTTEDGPLATLVAEEERAALKKIMASGMGDAEKAAAITKLKTGEMTAMQAMATAEMFPARANKSTKPLKAR